MTDVTSTTTNLDLTAVSPWHETFVWGAGVDALTGKVRNTAVAPFKLNPQKVSEVTKQTIRRIENDNDFDREISLSASGSYNMEGVTFSGSASYLNEVQYSDRSMTLLVVYEWSAHDAELADSYELTPDAKNVMANPDDFRERYGDYFIAGAWRGAYFHGLYVLHSSTSKTMNEFKVDLAANQPDVFDANASFNLKERMKKHSVSYSSEVLWDGHKGTTPDVTKDADPQQMLQYLNWFKNNLEPAPLKAYLRHYSQLNSKYPVTIDADPGVFKELKHLYRTIRQISNRLDGSLPTQVTRKIVDGYDDLVDQTTAGQSVLLKDKDQRAKCQASANALRAQLDDIADRRIFYEKVKGESLPGDSWNHSGTRASWSYGYSSYPDSAAVVIHKTEYEQFNPSTPQTWNMHDFTFSDSNALIVGFEIRSEWQDGLNGDWKLTYKPLLRNKGIVAVCSAQDRTTNWKCRWYYVDAKDYQFA